MQTVSNKQVPKKVTSVTFCVFIPLIIGLHVSWYMLQKRYVPLEERYDHPLVKLYKKYAT